MEHLGGGRVFLLGWPYGPNRFQRCHGSSTRVRWTLVTFMRFQGDRRLSIEDFWVQGMRGLGVCSRSSLTGS